MADGNLGLDKAVSVENFGHNIEACAQVLGHDLEWVAVRADLDVQILHRYKLGEGVLNEDRVETLRNVLGGIRAAALWLDLNDDERQDRMRAALEDADVDIPSDDTTSSDEQDSSVSAVGIDAFDKNLLVQDISWDEEGQIATLGKLSFNLKAKDFRATLVGNIRAAEQQQS